MGRTLPLFALVGSIGFGAFALAEEPMPRASDVPTSSRTPSAPEGERRDSVVGDVDASKVKQEDETPAADRGKRSTRVPRNDATDKDKASQSGNDATLRQLPSPAQRGSE